MRWECGLVASLAVRCNFFKGLLAVYFIDKQYDLLPENCIKKGLLALYFIDGQYEYKIDL
ncbi:MAG: hypothetical protein RBG13Loki_1895 [Promethearchaeota archaeon CR_4]|nr:MAG: hypothetical protein RBG13Loki_1895 [Candidatus Lokiarchaeota archaeon CR_4]